MPSPRSPYLVLPLALLACQTAPAPERPAEARAPIVGGIADTFRSYVVGVGDESSAFCTGTLISRRTVLTAGHCYTPGSAQGGITKIWFGADVSPGGGAVGVATVKAVRHPGYKDSNLANDLTLVLLAADAPSQPAPLLRETMTNTADFIGPRFTFSGYGNDGHYNYDHRRVVAFPIAQVGPAAVGLDTGTGPIDATMFYYRVQGKNTCDGDSGGPAFAVRDHVERLAGSTSFGDWSCVVDGVDARTDLPAITAFIQPTIDLFEGTDPCRADGICDESCNTGPDLVDPDCAPAHCGQDGICALSCVDPPDPDCAVVDHSGLDGVCDPAAAGDPDCAPAAVVDAGTGGAGGSTGGETTSTTSSASTGGGSTGGAGGSAGGEGGSLATADAGPDSGASGQSAPRSESGGCSVPAAPGGDPTVAVALAALGLSLIRRRRAPAGE